MGWETKRHVSNITHAMSNCFGSYKLIALYMLLSCASRKYVLGQLIMNDTEHDIEDVLTFGMQSSNMTMTLMRWNQTSKYLSEALNRTVDIRPVTNDSDMFLLTEDRSIDFVIAGPTLTACLQAQNNVTPLATFLSNLSDTVVTGLAGIIYTHINNTSINTVEDIRGQTVVGGPFTYLSAFQAQWGYLEMRGIELFGEAQNVFLYADPNQAILDVASGKYPVGFASASSPAMLQSKGILKVGDLKILNPIELPNFPYTTTTTLYPNSQLSAVTTVDYGTTLQVLEALERIPDYAAIPAQISGIQSGFNVFETLKLQSSIGVQSYPFNECKTLYDVTSLIRCKPGFHRDTRPCSAFNIICPKGATCICNPCLKNDAAIGKLSLKHFIIIIVMSALVLIGLIAYLARMHQLKIPGIKASELILRTLNFYGKVKWVNGM